MKKLLYIIFFICVFGCLNNDSKTNIKYEENNILKSSISEKLVVIDSNYFGLGVSKKVYEENDSLYFLTLNSMQQKLEILNLTSKKVIKEIGFYESDELLREKFNFDDLYIHNLDSLFLFSSNNYKLVLMNKDGEVNNIWNLNSESSRKQSEDFLHITTTGSSTFHYNNDNKTILFRTFPPINFNLNAKFYSKPFGIKYNLKSNLLYDSFGRWPESYSEHDYLRPNNHILSYVPVFKEKIYYVSTRYNHNIYKHNLLDNKLIKVIDGKSNFLNDFEKLPKTENTQANVDYIRVNGYYHRLMHYPNSNFFYRVVLHNQPMRDKKTQLLKNPTFGRDFSIILFNQKMDKIGEYHFKNPENFTFLSVTASIEGLLINSKDSINENINNFIFINN